MDRSSIENLLNQLGRAIQRLEDVLKQKKTEYIRDASIQRFEFTFEFAWKTIKRLVEEEGGNAVLSPKQAFKEAFKRSWITDEKGWITILKTRNITVHTYQEVLAEEAYEKLPKFLEYFKNLYKTLKQCLRFGTLLLTVGQDRGASATSNGVSRQQRHLS